MSSDYIRTAQEQMGKALDGETDILTPNGFKKMKDIVVGDYVFDEKGKQVKVVNKTEEQLNRSCYAVNFRHGETIIADGSHLWEVSVNGNDSSIYTTNELQGTLSDDVDASLRIPCADTVEFDTQPLASPYEVAGTLASIPMEYILSSVVTRLELLRGLMDTHGMVEEDGACRFYHSDIQMVDNVRVLLSTLGVICTHYNAESSYTLKFQHPTANGHDSFYIKSIEPVDSVPVYCIEVDNESHLFLAGRTLVPTHNCVDGDTNITVRNKTTGEILEATIKDFHEMNKSN